MTWRLWRILNDVLSISRITIIDVVDLPQPDSPTRPTLSPRRIEKLMPSTARNTALSGTGFLPPNHFEIAAPWRGYSLTSLSTCGVTLIRLHVPQKVRV